MSKFKLFFSSLRKEDLEVDNFSKVSETHKNNINNISHRVFFIQKKFAGNISKGFGV